MGDHATQVRFHDRGDVRGGVLAQQHMLGNARLTGSWGAARRLRLRSLANRGLGARDTGGWEPGGRELGRCRTFKISQHVFLVMRPPCPYRYLAQIDGMLGGDARDHRRDEAQVALALDADGVMRVLHRAGVDPLPELVHLPLQSSPTGCQPGRWCLADQDIQQDAGSRAGNLRIHLISINFQQGLELVDALAFRFKPFGDGAFQDRFASWA